jgi:SNF2 family DNA or RNA helicase
MRSFHDMTMRAITQFKSVARPEATEIVHRAMQPAVRFTLQDVMELPETVYIDKLVKLDPPAKAAYDRLFQKARMITDGGKSITAVNEGVLHGKLMQVACGYIYADDHTVYELPHKGRLDALLEMCEEADGKIIVFCPYVHALSGVAGFLRNAGYITALVHGGTPRGQRDIIFQAFQDHPTTPRIIVAQPKCMSHGLTLTAADTIIWYAPTESLETYEQGNARIIRPGQKRKTRVAHLFGTSVERVTYNRLKARAKMQGCLLEMFHSQELIF